MSQEGVAMQRRSLHDGDAGSAENTVFCGKCCVNNFDAVIYLLLHRRKNLITKELGPRLKNLHLTHELMAFESCDAVQLSSCS